MKETLKKLRTGNRYSQDLLAKILGISRLSYMKYESGEVEPPVEIIRKLAKIYKVSYETLIDNELKSENLSFSYDFSNNKNHDFGKTFLWRTCEAVHRSEARRMSGSEVRNTR